MMVAVAAWNIQSGGFDGYDEEATMPPRLPGIKKTVRQLTADVTGLIDTFRWHELFKPEELAEQFGYQHAVCINMDCDRVDGRIGLTALYNDSNIVCTQVRLVTRNCLKLLLPVPSGQALVYIVYLDHLSEDMRQWQIEALLDDASRTPRLPVLIVGDFNTLRPSSITPGWRLAGRLLRLPGLCLLRSQAPTVIREATRALVIPHLERVGFVDMGRTRPHEATVSVRRIGLRLDWCVDYVLARNWPVVRCRVTDTGAVSDHQAIVAETSLNNSFTTADWDG
jgi:endonuclease/exonuclease/phosphatase family metal-dependent hydrolase